MPSSSPDQTIALSQLALAAAIVGFVGLDLVYPTDYGYLLRIPVFLLCAMLAVTSISLLGHPARDSSSRGASSEPEETSSLVPVLRPMLNAVSESMKSQIDAISSYSDVLQSASKRLTLDGSQANVRVTIEQLLDENQTMKALTEKTKSELHSKSLEIETLRLDLDTAKRDAQVDGLTQISNRRYIMDVLEARTKSGTDAPFCLAMLDIDHFKSLNDTFGHQVGDIILKHYAGNISRLLRGRDLVARYGGEEFIIFLNNVKLHQAVSILQRIHAKLDNINWTAVQELQSVKGPMEVTSSIGVVEWSREENVEELIGRTDKLLYKAKEEGRARIVSH
jgi:diguanylate cyclase (GGDEF)-like protein